MRILPGQYYDQETNLFYNINRYYDPTIGGYTQPDLIGNVLYRDMAARALFAHVSVDTDWIDQLFSRTPVYNQSYSYVSANPLMYVDPYGLWHYGGNAHGPLDERTTALMQCMDTCTHRDLCVTSGNDGTHSGPNDPHLSGQAVDIGKNSNPGITRTEMQQCFVQCTAQDPSHNYGQEEGNHYHYQTRAGRGGANGFAAGVH